MPKSPVDRTESNVAALAALFIKAEAELTRLIYEALISGKTTSKRYRNQRRAVAQRLLRQLEKAALPQASRLVTAAYSIGELEARRVLKAPPVSARKEAATRTLTSELEKVVKQTVKTTGGNVDLILRKEALRVVKEGEGGNAAMAQKLAERLTRQGITGYVDKAGRQWTLAGYTQMVVATVAGASVNAGTIETMKARDFDLVIINQLEGSCEICKPYEGNVYSISGENKTYPKLDPSPPFHPGACRHYASPSKLALADRRAREAVA